MKAKAKVRRHIGVRKAERTANDLKLWFEERGLNIGEATGVTLCLLGEMLGHIIRNSNKPKEVKAAAYKVLDQVIDIFSK